LLFEHFLSMICEKISDKTPSKEALINEEKMTQSRKIRRRISSSFLEPEKRMEKKYPKVSKSIKNSQVLKYMKI